MTMQGSVSDYQVGLWIAELVAVDHYVSLHTSDPRIGDPTAHELADPDYHRQDVTFVATGARVIANVDPLTWLNLDDATISYLGVFAGATDANLRFATVVSPAVTVSPGHAYAIASGELYIRW